ncbi:MAG: hypothetical protein AAF465_11235 [Pseudomonadota bacterium]
MPIILTPDDVGSNSTPVLPTAPTAGPALFDLNGDDISLLCYFSVSRAWLLSSGPSALGRCGDRG